MKNKLKTFEELKKILNDIRSHNKRIVFTNGCFDIIHAGHVQYLQEARNLGDILIIGLNSDDSVKRLKGKSRPVNTQKDRAIVLSALESVSFVVIFHQDTPYELIKDLKPDVLVKGGDWKPEDIVGSDVVLKNNGEVKSLSYIKGRSSTEILDKLKEI